MIPREFDRQCVRKGGWVLYMLRHQLGEGPFNRALKHYLEVNRGKNVVTADFVKAVEESTYSSVQPVFQSMGLRRRRSNRFDVAYTYDDSKHQVALTVKQTQQIEGRVGLFRMPVDVEITTDRGGAPVSHCGCQADGNIFVAGQRCAADGAVR